VQFLIDIELRKDVLDVLTFFSFGLLATHTELRVVNYTTYAHNKLPTYFASVSRTNAVLLW